MIINLCYGILLCYYRKKIKHALKQKLGKICILYHYSLENTYLRLFKIIRIICNAVMLSDF